MSVTLMIPDVPDELARRLRARAAGNRRTLQAELLDIVETAVRAESRRTLQDLVTQGQRLGLSGSPAESAGLIRDARDRDDRR
ncbi:FitA-like ribbon-helix-helix domain-containing protein [Plasticicumulans sp.]|uniref:FitA-like ribbon-helix-helix domain-containing protein n=1 Tax=Plasticicumulans sp. TaxID=2307179 RepID=UPI002BF212D5|nr:hypothetical protein [Plasticicumulans sp.]MBS0600539.1 hypothetical protein [Pseudomonadota bacterium]HMV38810.1 hypothetical protein [Plasticicumulans sp.]HMW30092.1 hypothetical protein [Plasticicumulans sp.]HMW42849.1 hypothetical protein [Plasticicumulans sp.]HMX54777.1 hypothetical protein [Plasticicumulans sp.]